MKICTYCQRGYADTDDTCPTCGSSKHIPAKGVPKPNFYFSLFCIRMAEIAAGISVPVVAITGVLMFSAYPFTGLLIMLLGTPVTIGLVAALGAAHHYTAAQLMPSARSSR